MKTKINLLSEHIFTLNDQTKFAELSGDYNPIHIDNKYARRTQFGQVIVHGVHVVMWCLESLFKKNPSIMLAGFEVKFLQPIFLNEKINCQFDQDSNEIIAYSKDVRCVIIRLHEGSNKLSQDECYFASSQHFKRKPKEPVDKQLCLVKQGEIFKLNYYTCVKKLQIEFRNSIKCLGLSGTNDIVNLSAVVGMFLPGKHSIFSSFKIALGTSTKDNNIEIRRTDSRFGICDYKVNSENSVAEVNTIFRARIKSSFDLKYSKADRTREKKWENHRVLVVGGSRGLGSQLVLQSALHGADVKFTYNVGFEEAEALKACVSNYSDKVSLEQFSAENPNYEKLSEFKPNIVFYMLTPAIFTKRTRDYDDELFWKFHYFYCELFSKLIRVLDHDTLELIYYPSSVAVSTDRNANFEYAAAKELGEVFAQVEARYANSKVLIDRLPRLETDQTTTHLNIKAMKTHEIAEQIINKAVDLLEE